MVPRSSEQRVRLRKALERNVKAGHPWLYRDALEPFAAEPGAVVRVTGKSGAFLARGLADEGPIAVRLFATSDEPIDEALFARRIRAALELRARVVPEETDAYRLLHGEGDRLPGIVCDRYGTCAVLKCDGAAARAWQPRVADWLRAPLAELGIDTLLVRDASARPEAVTVAWGTAPPAELVVRERGMRLATSVWRGQKTGLFLDHRESRRRVRELAAGLRVLNLYGYTGGFSVAAGLGDAVHVTTIDSSAPALEHARASWTHNRLEPSRHTLHAADVPESLNELAARAERCDLVIADPPNFAPSESAKTAVLAGYAALHAAVFALLAPGGYYLAASCSSHVTQQDWSASLREGERRARRSAQVLERWGAPADHPRLVAFPEGDYLKVALLRVA